MPRILLVEDNDGLARGILHNLELEGYETTWAADGTRGLAAALANPPDLVILDLMLPGLDGFEVLRRLREGEAGSRVPVIILSARGEEVDKVRGFRLDADQYVTKPFGLFELLERVRSLLRRHAAGGGEHPAQRTGSAPAPLRFGDVEVDEAARVVRRAGEPVALTPRAFDLLLMLAHHEGRVLSRQELLRQVWGHRAAVVTRTVDSHVSELRQKLEADPANPRHIHTVWKVGYRFSAG
jgi:two-component system, OmpR family, alkaline phosphatase synthesis response regulator PhoP